MDPSGLQPSPRRELQIQGRRPSPLSVSKDSHKIRKPPIAPPPTAEHQPPPLQPPLLPPRRDPVIIYSVPPKIIHATPSEFMTLVQRLTGPESADPPHPPSLPAPGGALSPAARIASFERPSARASAGRSGTSDLTTDGLSAPDRQTQFPGILMPMPAALPPISPNLFSPSFDLSFLFDSSPAFANKNPNNLSNSFLASPSNNLLSTPTVPSPGAFWDLLNQFPDSSWS